MNINWHNSTGLPSRDFTCGYCDASIASNLGYQGNFESTGSQSRVFIYICHKCSNVTYFSPDGKQYPGAAYGGHVEDIPNKSVLDLYDEARSCTAANAYTAAVLCCRKLLMNLAVAEGADEGKRFIEYVDYLDQNGFLPPGGKDWVDHIRKKGNEATHEIEIMKKEDAEELLSFVEILLRFMYEFPARMQRKIAANP